MGPLAARLRSGRVQLWAAIVIAAVVLYVGLGVRRTLPGDEDSDSIMRLAVVGAKNTSDAIKSGQGKVTAHWRSEDREYGVVESVRRYDVAFSGHRFRADVEETLVRDDARNVDEAQRRLLAPPGTVSRHAVASDGSRDFVDYPDKNIVSIHPNGTSEEGRRYRDEASLEGLGFRAAAAGGFTSARREQIEGKKYLILERQRLQSMPKTPYWVREEHWTDPDRGFITSRLMVFVRDDGTPDWHLSDTWETEVRDYGDGLWAPAKCIKTTYRPDSNKVWRKRIVSTTTLERGFRFNCKVEGVEFSPVPQSGRKVFNEALDASYVVP